MCTKTLCRIRAKPFQLCRVGIAASGVMLASDGADPNLAMRGPKKIIKNDARRQRRDIAAKRYYHSEQTKLEAAHLARLSKLIDMTDCSIW